MKKIFVALLFTAAAGAAVAGGYSDPIVVPDVVQADAVESAGSDEWVGVLMVFLTIVLVGLGS